MSFVGIQRDIQWLEFIRNGYTTQLGTNSGF